MSRDSELDQNLSGDFQNIFSSDLNEIWYVGRGRWVMHDGMPYGRNQGQGHSREVDRQSPTGLIFDQHFSWNLRLALNVTIIKLMKLGMDAIRYAAILKIYNVKLKLSQYEKERNIKWGKAETNKNKSY